MVRKTTLLFGLLVASIAFAATATAATPISGTVTVANGTADGANVTVTPMSQRFQRVGNPVKARVDGTKFSVDAPDAPVYLVQVVYGGAVHYDVLRNETAAEIHLSRSLSGRVVNASGAPRRTGAVELVSPTGFSVDRTRVGENGTFAFGPLQSNRTYRVQVTVDGVPYVRSVRTDGNASVTVPTPPPTDDASVLNVSGGNPASHVLQVVAPKNGTGSPSVVETLTFRNTGDRPYVGPVTVVTPDAAKPYAAMFQGRQREFRRTARGVAVNVTIPANATARVGVAYDLRGRTVRKRFGHAADTVSVVLRGYDAANVNHSANLEVGSAPLPMLTNADPIARNDTIRVSLPAAATGSNASGSVRQASAESNSMPAFPAGPLFGGLAAMVVGGFVAYRVF